MAIFVGGVALMGATLFSATFAWFETNNKGDFAGGTGYTASAYFAGGNGSSATPYIINQPVHLYNLAWLQYLGFFNKTENGAYKQTYFVLGSDVDMSSSTINWTLPPIGTSNNPFIGNFDGKGYTISNLVVDNSLGDGHITRKPSTVDAISGVNIVGTFGVVGAYNLNSSYTYSSATNAVKNVTLSNVEVKTSLSSSLIGIAAGYVNAAITDVGILSSKVTINSGAAALDSTLTSNLSDYSTVGYCTAAFKTTRNLSTTSIQAPSTSTAHFTSPQSGSASGWGGSVDMESMYNRLLYFHNNPTRTYDMSTTVLSETVTISPTGGSTTSNTTYYSDSNQDSYLEYHDDANPLRGSYSFGRQFNWRGADMTTYLYLNGYRTFPKTTTQITQSYSAIYSNGNYLVNSGKTAVTNSTDSAASAIWIFSGNPSSASSTTISTIISGTTYYLRGSSSGLSLGKTSQTWYIYSGSSTSAGFYFYTNNSYYFLRYSNGWSTVKYNFSPYYVSFSNPSSTQTITSENDPTYDTYFPLNVYGTNADGNDPYYPTNSNTGYVVSGAEVTSGTSYGYGNIRVSQYSMSDLSTSLGSNSYNSTGSNLEVVTRTANSGGFVRISDGYNASNTASSTLSQAFGTKTNFQTLGLEKYEKSRTTLHGVLSNSTAIYGLHFLDATINQNDLATADHVRVSKPGTTTIDYESYQMPRNSIDFNLRERGYINFFAGSYYSNNDSFFSLHQITRDANQKISSIKQISKVYGTSSPSDPFIYLYSDGIYSASLTSSYSMIFDSTWIESPTMVDNAMYYFEVPVNAGEYALGSVSNGIGAYLIYLDISANAQEINRTIVTEYILSVTNTYEYPLGVSLIAVKGDAVDPLTGAAIALNAGYSGTMSLSKASNTITLTSTSNTFTPGWKGDAITLARSGSTDPPSVVPKLSSTSTLKRLTYIDYNTTTMATTYTIVTDQDGTLSYVDGDGTTITSFADSTGKVVETSTLTSIDVSALTTTICSYWYSYSAATSTITATFVFTHEQDTTNTTLHADKVTGYTITVKSTSEAVNINVTVKDGNYVITINGTTITVGTVVAVLVTTA